MHDACGIPAVITAHEKVHIMKDPQISPETPEKKKTLASSWFIVLLILGGAAFLGAAIILPGLSSYRNSHHDKIIKETVDGLSASQEQYYAMHKAYAADPADLKAFTVESGYVAEITGTSEKCWSAKVGYDAERYYYAYDSCRKELVKLEE